MARKKTRDDEQESRSKRSVKQATRKVISTSATKYEGTKSSKVQTNKTQSSALSTQATRSDKLDKKLAAATQTASKIERKTRGLAFPSNHFQTTSTARSTNGNKTKTKLMSGELLLNSTSAFPSTAPSRVTTLSHTNAQDSLVSVPIRTKQKETFSTTFETQIGSSNKRDAAQAASVFKTPEEWTQDVWNAVKRGDRQLGYASKLEKELEDKYGSLDYAKYIPEYKGLVTAIRQAQTEYQKQREFIEKNYRQLPLPAGQTTNHTNADRWYYEERLRQIREEMASYDEMCGGRMDLASLRSYYEQINLYESILATEPNTKGEQYMDDTFEQVLKGNYTDKVTGLGTAYQVGLALLGLDLPMDIRDASYDWTHLKTTPWHQTILDTAAFLPLVGAFKYTDNVADVLKSTTKGAEAADVLATAAKHADDAIDYAKYLDEAADAAKRSNKSLEILDDVGYIGEKAIPKVASLDTLNITQGKVQGRKAFNQLVDSIKKNGITETIKCVEYKGELYVVDGHHRLLAARYLGYNDVPIEIVGLPYKGYKTIKDLFYWD